KDLQYAPAGCPSGRTAGSRAIASRIPERQGEILSEECAMKVTVTARHAKFTDALKEVAAQKAQHLEHFFDHLKKIEVILDTDGDKHYAVEMIASGLHDHVIVSHSSDKTALAAL